jgi:hypothetical protein
MKEPYRTFPAVLIFDNQNQLPVQFRDTSLAHATASFSVQGLAELRASGSSRFDLPQLEALLDRIGSKKGVSVYLVDLRQESQDFYHYAKLGYPWISWLAWVSQKGTQAAVESASA